MSHSNKALLACCMRSSSSINMSHSLRLLFHTVPFYGHVLLLHSSVFMERNMGTELYILDKRSIDGLTATCYN